MARSREIRFSCMFARQCLLSLSDRASASPWPGHAKTGSAQDGVFNRYSGVGKSQILVRSRLYPLRSKNCFWQPRHFELPACTSELSARPIRSTACCGSLALWGLAGRGIRSTDRVLRAERRGRRQVKRSTARLSRDQFRQLLWEQRPMHLDNSKKMNERSFILATLFAKPLEIEACIPSMPTQKDSPKGNSVASTGLLTRGLGK